MAGTIVKTISGIDIYEIGIKLNQGAPEISVDFKPELATLIEITATPEDSDQPIGKSIINDQNPDNNIIVISNYRNLLGKVIWLRTFIYHPTLKKYDFRIHISQSSEKLHTYTEQDSLDKFAYFWRGFILKEVKA